jgi:hypothetical protein
MALLETMDARGGEMFAAFWQTEPRTRASVRAWLAEIAQFYIEFREDIRATSQALGDDPELAQRVAETQTSFVKLFAEHLAPDPDHKPLIRASLLEAQRDMIMRWWIIEGRELGSGDEILDALADVWSDALGID